MNPVLVTGATGPHGGAVVAALLQGGQPVRALTRDPRGARARELAAAGAELVAGDLLDRRALASAMRDARATYAVTTPFGGGPAIEVQQGRQIIAAAQEVRLPWLVLASVASADHDTGVPHFDSKWRIEQALQASGLPHTVVAPTYFFENIGNLAEQVASGELALPLPPSRPLQQIALADLGAVVASLLARRDEFLEYRIEVAADEPTPQAMAQALSIPYRRTDLREVAARSTDLASMYRFLSLTGYHVEIARTRASFPGVDWTPFSRWVDAHLADRRA